MRKLQYVFMALAVLCFAIPAFADGGSSAINLAPIGAGIGIGLSVGGAVLTPNLRDFSGGLYAKVTAFTIKF